MVCAACRWLSSQLRRKLPWFSLGMNPAGIMTCTIRHQAAQEVSTSRRVSCSVPLPQWRVTCSHMSSSRSAQALIHVLLVSTQLLYAAGSVSQSVKTDRQAGRRVDSQLSGQACVTAKSM